MDWGASIYIWTDGNEVSCSIKREGIKIIKFWIVSCMPRSTEIIAFQTAGWVMIDACTIFEISPALELAEHRHAIPARRELKVLDD